MADQYIIKDSLGRGASGCAFLAERVCDGAHVVIKQVVLSTMTAEQKQKAVNEAQVMTHMDHMNVIKYLDSYEQDDTLNIVLEYAPHGDLSNLIQERAAAQKPFTEDEIMFWGVQVTLALWHVHSKHILHRDLKSSNVFIGKGGVAKLGDFGIARALSSTQDVASTMVGTPFYLSPEICQDQPYDKKSDVWSLGIILYELCTLRRPFEAPNLPALVMKILGGKYPPVPTRYSGPLRQLVDQCLQVEPRERLSSEQILQSDYVRYHLARYAQHVMRMTQSELSSAPLTLPGGKQPATRARKPGQQAPSPKQQQEAAGVSSSSSDSSPPAPPSDAAAPCAVAEAPSHGAAGPSSGDAPGLVEERSDTDMAAAGGAGAAARGRHQQLQDGWLEAQQAALEEMQAMLSALNDRGRASPVPGAPPSPRAAAAAAAASPSSPAQAGAASAVAAPAASRVHLGELMQVAGSVPSSVSASAGPSAAAAVAAAAAGAGAAAAAGPRRSVTPPKAPPAAGARSPTPPRQTGAAAAGSAPCAPAAAAGGGGSGARRAPGAGQGPAAAVAAAGTPAKQRSQGALLPAVPKPPANAVDLGLEELAAAGQLGMDNIQIPGMTAEACKPGKQLKGLAPKQVQVQRAIVAAKQHRHQEKQQYKQLQETLAREEEARRATRAAELEAAQQERIEKQQKERQQAAEAAAAHKRAVKRAHARVDKSKLHQLGEQFLQQLHQQQQQAAAGNAAGLVMHVALDGDDQQQQQQQQRASGSASAPAEPGSRTSFHSRGSCSSSTSSCQASQPASCTSSSPASRRASASSSGPCPAPSGKQSAADSFKVGRIAAQEVQPHGNSPGAWTIAAGAANPAAVATGSGGPLDGPGCSAEAAVPCNPQMLHVLGQIHDVLATGGVAFVVGSTTSAATRKGQGV